MESEKVMYWVTLGVLAMAATGGLITKHRGWGEGLADRSIALMSQASKRAMNYAEIAGIMVGTGDSARSRAVVDVDDYVQDQVQVRLACAQATLARRQADLDRLQSMKVQVRLLQHPARTMVWRNPDIVVEVPQPPQVQVDTF